uniref:Uncharacterized protein n=1 Tax=Arundo donax TaxID=35708 RepID=A0A0A9DSJ6_ARUDO
MIALLLARIWHQMEQLTLLLKLPPTMLHCQKII